MWAVPLVHLTIWILLPDWLGQDFHILDDILKGLHLTWLLRAKSNSILVVFLLWVINPRLQPLIGLFA
jgi:hypothetical protein